MHPLVLDYPLSSCLIASSTKFLELEGVSPPPRPPASPLHLQSSCFSIPGGLLTQISLRRSGVNRERARGHDLNNSSNNEARGKAARGEPEGDWRDQRAGGRSSLSGVRQRSGFAGSVAWSGQISSSCNGTRYLLLQAATRGLGVLKNKLKMEWSHHLYDSIQSSLGDGWGKVQWLLQLKQTMPNSF